MNSLLAKFKHRATVRRRARNIREIRMDKLPNEIFNKIKETFDPQKLVKSYSGYKYNDEISMYYWNDGHDCGYTFKVNEIELETSVDLASKIYNFFERKYGDESIPCRIKHAINNL